MAANTFGVTPTTVAALHFPMIPGFTAATKPTTTTVTLMVSHSSGDLAGRLYKEGITASAITDTASIAYLRCAEQLNRMVALKVLKAMSQQFPELSKELQREVDAWFVGLGDDGGTWLGDEALDTGATPADGPNTHINTYDLDTIAADDMSSAAPRLKADDQL